MNLYKISQSINDEYDTYDSAVVCAETEDAARLMHPGGYDGWGWDCRDTCIGGATWVHPGDVEVELLGVAREGLKPGVVVASFNAG